MSECECKEAKHKCAFKECTNHVMKGTFIDRYLGVCEYHFKNLFKAESEKENKQQSTKE